AAQRDQNSSSGFHGGYSLQRVTCALCEYDRATALAVTTGEGRTGAEHEAPRQVPRGFVSLSTAWRCLPRNQRQRHVCRVLGVVPQPLVRHHERRVALVVPVGIQVGVVLGE